MKHGCTLEHEITGWVAHRQERQRRPLVDAEQSIRSSGITSSSPRPISTQKQRGAWYTPVSLIEPMVDWIATRVGLASSPHQYLTAIDPACGDGRLLTALGSQLARAGWAVDLHGVDLDGDAVAIACRAGVRAVRADALHHQLPMAAFDIVIGNPPFLSQMSAATSRGGSSTHGGGPYADAAVEFMALASRLVRPDGGLIALVLPQSILGARDARSVRRELDERARIDWTWWAPDQADFDASVNVCMLGWTTPGPNRTPWTSVVTDRLGVPPINLHQLSLDGTVGDRNLLNANFRDEYYALVPAVSDDADGPPLVTSGLIDPGRNWWGHRPVRFAKRSFAAPSVDLSKLTGRFPAWAERKLVPKVLIANQTSVIEAVADPDGAWLPGVPVTTATPNESLSADHPTDVVFETAAVLTSPVATAAAWHLAAGTGLSTRSVRIGPQIIGSIPWPSGSLDEAVRLLTTDAPVVKVGRAVMSAYGLDPNAEGAALTEWWSSRLPSPD